MQKQIRKHHSSHILFWLVTVDDTTGFLYKHNPDQLSNLHKGKTNVRQLLCIVILFSPIQDADGEIETLQQSGHEMNC